MPEFWSTIAQQIGGGSRTDVLRALVWPNAMLVVGLMWGATHAAPMFVLILLSMLLVIFMLLYAGAYILFGRQDPNLLRSERYNLEKMALEHGLIGDNVTGLIERPAPTTIEGKTVEKGAMPKIEHRND